MVRRYAEPVTVGIRLAAVVPDSPAGFDRPDGYAAAAPEWFLWRGRRYAVHAVLAHWRERRAWWRDALDPTAGDGEPGEARESQPAPGRIDLSTGNPRHRSAITVAARERLVWRVEAAPGWLRRAEHTGVFDLACDEGVADTHSGLPGPPDPSSWVLLRVAD